VSPAGSSSGGSAVPAGKCEGGWKYPPVSSSRKESILSATNFGWTQNRDLWLCMVTANGYLKDLNLNGSGSSITVKAPRWASTQSGAQNDPSSGLSFEWLEVVPSKSRQHTECRLEATEQTCQQRWGVQVHSRAPAQAGLGRCKAHKDEEV
jgi:hypothetical protein